MSDKPFTLYPTSLFLYEDCPQSFLWKKGWGNIDLGRGPGKGKEVPVKKSEHHQIMGISIQAAIERMYNDTLWSLISPTDLPGRMVEIGLAEMEQLLARKYVDWFKANMTRQEMEDVVRNGILGYMRTLKAHKLLGPYAKAEVELLAYIDKYNPIGGRADVIIRREDTGTIILDGKNSKRFKDPKNKGQWMTYTDPDQLRYYALLYYLCYHKLPERLAFVYYRFPYGDPVIGTDGQPIPGQTEPGIDFVPFTKDDLKGLAQRAVDTRKSMEKELFDARPTPSKCRMCDFETVCPERQQQIALNRRGPRKNSDVLEGATGFVNLNFGDGVKKNP